MSAGAKNASALDQAGMQHLMGYLLTLAEVAARRVYQRHIGTPFKLRPVEFTLLVLLLGNGSATPKQLAQTLSMPPPNVTVLIDRLVDRALVQRSRSEADRRATNLLLTDKGRELAQRTQRASLTMEGALLSPLSTAERAMLAELLQKMTHGTPWPAAA
jgi:DNA-binding MarR family transcriptional regulator